MSIHLEPRAVNHILLTKGTLVSLNQGLNYNLSV